MKSLKEEVIVYQSKSGSLVLKGDLKKDTIWATQSQIAELFELERSVCTKHIRNILNHKELLANQVCAKFAHTAADGKKYQVQFYNLDLILAVGYRANSVKAVEFRKWATKVLSSHIVQGYTINKKRISHNYEKFLSAVEQVKNLLPSGGLIGPEDTLELVKMFASTWFSLDAYDKSALPASGVTKKQANITGEELANALQKLKHELIRKEEATKLFGAERSKDAVAGIVGNVLQSFGGHDLYPSIEEKAAHLLYFMVKNHPFTDGNKRSGAFTFVWFLKKTGILNTQKLSPQALTALTLLVAESNPKDKERMVGLILLLLKK